MARERGGPACDPRVLPAARAGAARGRAVRVPRQDSAQARLGAARGAGRLAGGVGIGGVLEPPGARPVIVPDGAFVGSRAAIVEGVVVGERAVSGPHVTLGASIPVIDVT